MKKVRAMVHPEALESLRRYKDDLKAKHTDAAEYWRGQAGAYFTANPFSYETYDFEKENYKKCPVCGRIIDYHVKGFYHDTVLNVWICREHTLDEIQQHLTLKDKKLIDFIISGEAPLICPSCAGKPGKIPEEMMMFTIRPCSICGRQTAPELGAVIVGRGYNPRRKNINYGIPSAPTTYIYIRDKDGKCVHAQAWMGHVGTEYEHDDPNWKPPKDWPYKVVDMRKKGRRNPENTINVRIYYWKDIKYHSNLSFDKILPTPSEIEVDYAMVWKGELPRDVGLEGIYSLFNMDHNPLGTPEGQNTLRRLGVHHTSMSVADIVMFGNKIYICMPYGFQEYRFNRNPIFSGFVSGIATGAGLGLASRLVQSNPRSQYVKTKCRKCNRTIYAHVNDKYPVCIECSRKTGYRNPFIESLVTGLGVGAGLALATVGTKYIGSKKAKKGRKK